jgi:hypothetical protein
VLANRKTDMLLKDVYTSFKLMFFYSNLAISYSFLLNDDVSKYMSRAVFNGHEVMRKISETTSVWLYKTV